MIELKNITKIYCSKSNTKVCALNDISLIFPQKGLFFIVGKSGCGKTTLLNIIGGLDAPTSGEIYFKKNKLDLNNPSVADNYRKQSIGFIFQDFNLLDDETIIENVDIAAQLVGKTNDDVMKAISQVGLTNQSKQCANELSGGQKQRVAIARALVKDAEVILADEPTGNLDSTTAEDIFLLLKKLSNDRLVIVITHDNESAEKYGDGIVHISDGKIIDSSIDNSVSTTSANTKNTKENSYLVSKKTLFRLGIKNLKCKKGRSVLVTIMLFLSITVLLWSQMLLSTTSEKVLGRALTSYDQQQILLYQGNNFDKYVLRDDSWNGSNPTISQSALKYIFENTDALPLIRMDSQYIAIISGKEDIQDVGFELYDNSLELTNANCIYVSDYLFDEEYSLSNGCFDYSEYIGKEVIVSGKKGILAGVFKTNYLPYVNWNYQYNRFERKSSLQEAEEKQLTFIEYLKNIIFCSEEYYTEQNLNGYVFNAYVKDSERKDGSVNYYGLMELTFSTNESSVIITDKVRITDKANNSHFDVSGEYIEEYFVPNKDEIYISQSLYRRLFEPTYDGNSSPLYLGSAINISLCEYGNKTVLSSIEGKILAGVYGESTGAYSFSIAKENDIDFKQHGINYPFLLTNISKMSSKELTEFLTILRNRYEVASVSMLSSWIYYIVEEQFVAASIIMSAVAIIIFIITLLLVINLVMTIISSKTKEIGIMRSIGMRSKDIIFIYSIKIIILSLVSFSLSIIGALVGIPILAKGFMADESLFISWISFDWLSLLIGVVLGIIVPIGLSLICLLNINKMKPVDAIKTQS